MPQLIDNPTLTDLQMHIKQICIEKGWKKNSITEIYLPFGEEVGELAKAIRKATGLKGESTESGRQNLEEEFGDVLTYLMDLANFFMIDPEAAYRKKTNINHTREWK